MKDTEMSQWSQQGDAKGIAGGFGGPPQNFLKNLDAISYNVGNCASWLYFKNRTFPSHLRAIV